MMSGINADKLTQRAWEGSDACFGNPESAFIRLGHVLVDIVQTHADTLMTPTSSKQDDVPTDTISQGYPATQITRGCNEGH